MPITKEQLKAVVLQALENEELLKVAKYLAKVALRDIDSREELMNTLGKITELAIPNGPALAEKILLERGWKENERKKRDKQVKRGIVPEEIHFGSLIKEDNFRRTMTEDRPRKEKEEEEELGEEDIVDLANEQIRRIDNERKMRANGLTFSGKKPKEANLLKNIQLEGYIEDGEMIMPGDENYDPTKEGQGI